MGARRGLTDAEALETESARTIYRTPPRAALDSSEAPASVSPRAARRRMSDDTTTVRPGWRAAADPVTTTIIRVKHAPTAKSKRGRIALVATAFVAATAITLGSLGYLTPGNHQAKPPLPAPYVAAAGVDGSDTNPGALGGAVDDSSTLSSSRGAASEAMAADAQVKAQAAAAKKAAAAAGSVAEQKATTTSSTQTGTGHTSADYSEHDIAGTPVVVPNGSVIWPVKGFTITSPFGWRIHPVYHVRKFHTGVDLAIGCGKPIYASADGVVTYSGWNGGYGNYVEIKSKQLGISLGYAHQSKIVAKVGQQVKQGQLIGYVGETGVATGCHVHFQAINGKGQFFNPVTLVH